MRGWREADLAPWGAVNGDPEVRRYGAPLPTFEHGAAGVAERHDDRSGRGLRRPGRGRGLAAPACAVPETAGPRQLTRSVIVDYADAVAAFFAPRQEGTGLPVAVADGSPARRLRDACEPV